MEKLVRFLFLLPTAVQAKVGLAEPMIRARALICYHTGNFKEFYLLLESHEFSPAHRPILQRMWWDAHYQEAEKIQGKTLGPVDKYCVRKKYPCPVTISDGEQIYSFNKEARNKLREHYLLDPCPNLTKQQQLAGETGLTAMQVENWYKNRRQRDRAASICCQSEEAQVEVGEILLGKLKNTNFTNKLDIGIYQKKNYRMNGSMLLSLEYFKVQKY